MNNSVATNGNFNDGYPVTPSDTVDVIDDPANIDGVDSVFLHNVATGAPVKVMPAGKRVPIGVTLTGSSGTANVTVNGVNYLATYSASLTVTAAAFVTTHQAALKALNIGVTSKGANIIFKGANQATLTVTNASGNLAGAAIVPSPVTIFIPQGGTSMIAVKRVYATVPTAPVGMIGYYGGNKQ